MLYNAITEHYIINSKQKITATSQNFFFWFFFRFVWCLSLSTLALGLWFILNTAFHDQSQWYKRSFRPSWCLKYLILSYFWLSVNLCRTSTNVRSNVIKLMFRTCSMLFPLISMKILAVAWRNNAEFRWNSRWSRISVDHHLGPSVFRPREFCHSTNNYQNNFSHYRQYSNITSKLSVITTHLPGTGTYLAKICRLQITERLFICSTFTSLIALRTGGKVW